MVSIPKSQPIKSLKELLAWQPGQDEYNVANTPLHLRPSPTLSASPYSDCRVIVCHDMAGGYAEDASPQGNSYSTLYSIQYWNHVDVFIYFSHSLITIPPVVWTNAAHRNGVRCLGTIITEWLPGVLVTDEMVSGPGQAFVDQEGNDIVDRRFFSRAYADKLVQLAVYFKFDGWFINIESILRGGNKQAEQMYAFLAYLRKRLHEAIPNGGELIWYDSVISSTGEVAWQDKLSSENYRFFEQSDGIFTNYTWKEGYVAESAALAGSRNRDVYTGIDIWGRNTFGGGGYTAYKALEVIQRDKTSCALFAPAWTYEFLDKKDFLTNDRLFWTGFHGAGHHIENLPLASFYKASYRLLSGDLGRNPNDKDKDKDNKAFLPISAYIPARPSGCSSWFYSNFDRGFGHGFWVNGKKVSNKPWSHLSHQSLSPSMTKRIFEIGEDYIIHATPLLDPSRKILCWALSPELAYNGGTSLLIQELTTFGNIPTLPDPPAPSLLPSVKPGLSTVNPRLQQQESSRTILVPLFNTQIPLLNAQYSAVELIYKPCLDTFQVGIHLGLSAVIAQDENSNDDESGGTKKAQQQDIPTRTSIKVGRKLARSELYPILRPKVKEHEVKAIGQGHSTPSNVSSELSSPSSSTTRTVLGALLTLDDSEQSDSDAPESAFAIALPPPSILNSGNSTDSDMLYSVEPLEEGWQRLTLHMSGIFDLHNESQDKSKTIASSVVVSQLGITLNYKASSSSTLLRDETLSASFEEKQEESRPLIILGSLSLMPTLKSRFNESCIQGVRAEETQLQSIERSKSCVLGQEQAVVVPDKAKESSLQLSPLISISSAIIWDIGYRISSSSSMAGNDLGIESYPLETVSTIMSARTSIFNTTATFATNEDADSISTGEYSHYCIYLSLQPSKNDIKKKNQNNNNISEKPVTNPSAAAVAETTKDEVETDYISTNMDEPIHWVFVGTAFTNRYRISNFELALNYDNCSSVDTRESLLALKDDKKELWAWVQGVRRDGQADDISMWGKVKLC